MHSQILLISLLALTLAGAALGAAIPRRSQRSAPNCASFLRILFPERFRHCDCTYLEWSEWSVVPNSVVNVNTAECPESGEAYSETRSRIALGEGCDPQTETRQICLPDPEDRLILALGLGNLNGGSNNPAPTAPLGSLATVRLLAPTAPPGSLATVRLLAPTAPPGSFATVRPPVPTGSFKITSLGSLDSLDSLDQNVTKRFVRPKRQLELPLCPANDAGDDPWVCSSLHDTQRKRSLHEEYHHFRSTEKTKEDSTPKQSSSTPLPFDWNLHHSRFRRQTPQSCYPNGIQHVLFLLDTSGSIGPSNWNRMTKAVSNLTALFCRPIRVAVMTFNQYFKLEFCFGCDFAERLAARYAIRNIPYRHYGSGATHTAGATLCACEKLLNPNCGLDPYANCIDVVYITDGKSNDHRRQVCDEVRCLHNHNVYGNRINTYSIGIGNINRHELDCIDNYSGVNSAFLFSDFIAFENAIQEIIDRLFDPNNSQYTCANPDGSLGP